MDVRGIGSRADGSSGNGFLRIDPVECLEAKT